MESNSSEKLSNKQIEVLLTFLPMKLLRKVALRVNASLGSNSKSKLIETVVKYGLSEKLKLQILEIVQVIKEEKQIELLYFLKVPSIFTDENLADEIKKKAAEFDHDKREVLKTGYIRDEEQEDLGNFKFVWSLEKQEVDEEKFERKVIKVPKEISIQFLTNKDDDYRDVIVKSSYNELKKLISFNKMED